MIHFPTTIPYCDCHSPALSDLVLSCHPSICFMVAFTRLRNSNHVVVLVSFDFPSKSKWGIPFISELLILLMLSGVV